MGQAMRDKGDLNESVRYYKRAGALRPDSAEAATDLGFALKRADKLEEAVTELKKAVKCASLPAQSFSSGGRFTRRDAAVPVEYESGSTTPA